MLVFNFGKDKFGEMAMKKILVVLAILFVGSYASAEISVPPGFVVDTLLDQIDSQTPRLKAITNSDYGSGVVAASIDSDNGILTVRRISASNIEILGVLSGFPVPAIWEFVNSINFDQTGLFGNDLYLTVTVDVDRYSAYTDFIHVSSSGDFNVLWTEGGAHDELGFSFSFTDDSVGYMAGAYFEDGDYADGTSLWHMDTSYVGTQLYQNLVPPGRTDLDIRAMDFDPTGLYGNYLTMVDSDDDDNKSVIYQLLPNLTWQTLAGPVTLTQKFYHDMSFSTEGTFGQMLYVTERVSESVMTVDPDGVHTVFASGFSNVLSVSVSDDGEHMFVSDENGIYRIRAAATTVGPQIVMQEPKVEAEGVHTNVDGINHLRLFFSERVLFDSSDITLTNADAISVPFSVSGSNSQFMILAFGEKLLNDRYTITIHDSVTSAVTSAAIDGDKDGLAGGDAVIVIEHRQRHDSDNDNDIDLTDLLALAEKWLWQE